jgi:hypothetical protein
MKNEKVLSEKINFLLETKEADMDLCTTIDESLNVTIDYCMLGAIKLTKFTMMLSQIKENVVEELSKEGVPKIFALKRVQLDLINWCQDYCDTFKERIYKNNLDKEEIFVEQKFLEQVSRMILDIA